MAPAADAYTADQSPRNGARLEREARGEDRVGAPCLEILSVAQGALSAMARLRAANGMLVAG